MMRGDEKKENAHEGDKCKDIVVLLVRDEFKSQLMIMIMIMIMMMVATVVIVMTMIHYLMQLSSP